MYIRHTKSPSVNIKQYLAVAQSSAADFVSVLTAIERFCLREPEEVWS